MNTDAKPDAPELVIPDCATCSHPPVRLFVELVCAVESEAPAWHSLELCRELARHGYKIDLVRPADERLDDKPGDWCWRLHGGKIVSGLPLIPDVGATSTSAPIAPGPQGPNGHPFTSPPDCATFERQAGRTRQGPTRLDVPSPTSRSARPEPGNTTLESSLQRTLLR